MLFVPGTIGVDRVNFYVTEGRSVMAAEVCLPASQRLNTLRVVGVRTRLISQRSSQLPNSAGAEIKMRFAVPWDTCKARDGFETKSELNLFWRALFLLESAVAQRGWLRLMRSLFDCNSAAFVMDARQTKSSAGARSINARRE